MAFPSHISSMETSTAQWIDINRLDIVSPYLNIFIHGLHIVLFPYMFSLFFLGYIGISVDVQHPYFTASLEDIPEYDLLLLVVRIIAVWCSWLIAALMWRLVRHCCRNGPVDFYRNSFICIFSKSVQVGITRHPRESTLHGSPHSQPATLVCATVSSQNLLPVQSSLAVDGERDTHIEDSFRVQSPIIHEPPSHRESSYAGALSAVEEAQCTVSAALLLSAENNSLARGGHIPRKKRKMCRRVSRKQALQLAVRGTDVINYDSTKCTRTPIGCYFDIGLREFSPSRNAGTCKFSGVANLETGSRSSGLPKTSRVTHTPSLDPVNFVGESAVANDKPKAPYPLGIIEAVPSPHFILDISAAQAEVKPRLTRAPRLPLCLGSQQDPVAVFSGIADTKLENSVGVRRDTHSSNNTVFGTSRIGSFPGTEPAKTLVGVSSARVRPLQRVRLPKFDTRFPKPVRSSMDIVYSEDFICTTLTSLLDRLWSLRCQRTIPVSATDDVDVTMLDVDTDSDSDTSMDIDETDTIMSEPDGVISVG